VRDTLILAYHAISPTWPAALSIEPERLDAQLAALTAMGYRATTFTEAVTKPPAQRTLAVTFDDGFRSIIELALPILERHNMVGTAFIPTAYIGPDGTARWPGIDRWIGGPHEPELALMSWADVDRLQQAGWEIGSHTVSHPSLTRLADGALHEELAESRRVCEERLGTRCAAVAYPYGDVDRRVMDAARACGYLAAAALPERIHRTHRFRWPRVGIWHNDPERVFAAKLSPLRRRRLDLRTGSMSLVPRWRWDG
jgi:peptidoglycan/xylan/chitin deacetylase (PgdA/CDA1 family)